MATTNIPKIDLSTLNRKQFDVNGKVLELDTSDIKILARFQSIYPTLYEEGAKLAKIQDAATENLNENLDEIVQILDEVDTAMRHAIDYIFDSNVCEVCVDHGSLFDPIDGEYRFERLVDTLLPLYDANLQEETKKIQKRIKKHTDKYVTKK